MNGETERGSCWRREWAACWLDPRLEGKRGGWGSYTGGRASWCWLMLAVVVIGGALSACGWRARLPRHRRLPRHTPPSHSKLSNLENPPGKKTIPPPPKPAIEHPQQMVRHAKPTAVEDESPAKNSETQHADDSEDEEAPSRVSKTKKTISESDEDVLKRRTLFVRSLPYTATSEALSTHFSFIAPLKHATVVADPTTKKSRGFGFVTYTDSDDARRAVKELNGSDFEGRKLKVEIAQPRHRDEAGKKATKDKKEEREQGDVKKRAPRLIVRNLAWSVRKPEQLIKIFQSYGKVREVIIPRKDNKPGAEMRGFAFVTMKGYRNAEKAIEKTNGIEIDGRVVAVDWAVEKDEWQKQQGGGEKEAKKDATPEAEDEEASVDEGQDEGEADVVGVISDDAAEDMNDAPDASDDEGSDIEMDDVSDASDGEPEPQYKHDMNDNSQTIFIRNLPFTTNDESLHEHFTTNFGPVRYARIVIDRETERPRGTGFVCFYDMEHCNECVKGIPRNTSATGSNKYPSLLHDEGEDPSGKYTIEGRVLSITRAVNKNEAHKLQEAGTQKRDKVAGDKRRLFLLQEGTIPASSPAFQTLSNTERQLRDSSLKQRKTLLQANPMLHLSLTRLSIRNLPRSITAKDLKALAREAAVGFVADVRAGKRQQLSKEELARGGADDKEAELRRKKQGKGIVRQAKIVEEQAGGGRSRGYGFIEYSSHRWALMGLRWLNGHAVLGTGEATEKKVGKGKKVDVPVEDKKKRLIVEFAIENAQVVARRKDSEEKARERSKLVAEGKAKPLESTKERKAKFAAEAKKTEAAKKFAGKRKRDNDKSKDEKGDGKRPRRDGKPGSGKPGSEKPETDKSDDKAVKKDEKQAKAARIIARKRQIRRSKRG